MGWICHRSIAIIGTRAVIWLTPALTVPDAGSGIDALTALDVALIESDTASGLDFALLSASLLAADLGLGLDEVTALAKALLATDLGIGSDRLVAKIESPSREGAIRLPPEGRKISIPSREVYL